MKKANSSYLMTGFNYPISNSDLSIINFGFQSEDKNHSQGPLTKNEHVLQYMTGGKGVLFLNGKTYHLKKGDLFYLPKNTLLRYFADKTEPYTYYWIGLDGSNVKYVISSIGLSEQTPVMTVDEETIIPLFEEIEKSVIARNFTGFILAHAKIYELLAYLTTFNPSNTKIIKSVYVNHIEKALTFIHENFGRDINVTEIASAIGLKRTYFCALFKRQVGYSPVDFLMNYRINQSKFMLSKGMSVTETAINCGFNSPSNFAAQFKKHVGIQPSKFRSNVIKSSN